MPDRAPRPLARLPRRLLRVTAGLIGAVCESRSGRLLVTVCALVTLGPAGYAAFGPVGPPVTQRQVVFSTIPSLSRDVEVAHGAVAREGDRQAELPAATEPRTASPTGLGPSSTPPAVPMPASTPSALPTPTATPTRSAHTHPAAPTPRPTSRPTPRSAPKPTPTPKPTPKPRPTPTGTSARRDTTSPNTRVVVQYSTRNAVTLVLSADEPALFVCSLDGAAYSSCSSPAHYLTSPGWHTFAVKAIDTAGNVDKTPATVHCHARGGGS